MEEEEYTDYSCSTALERLSRDVETTLRTWHVDKGCDRHVSLGGVTSSSDYVGDNPSCPLIRSNTIVWNIPVTTRQGRSVVTVDLELALWDEPGASGTLAVDLEDVPGAVEPLTAASASAEDAPSLVKSLQRSPFGIMPANDFLFDNFARLFGIGQHISLSPIQPEIPLDLLEWIGASVLERHDDQATAQWVLGSTLGGWLQTALNCATSNCHCGIPAFGVWGIYRPNELQLVQPQQPYSGSTTASQFGDVTTTQLSAHSPASLTVANPDYLVGTTIQAKEFDGNSSTGAAGTASVAAATIHKAAPPRGIPIFPTWAQALVNAELPAVSRAYKRRAQRTFWNSHYVPPLVCGRVTSNIAGTALDTPTTAATMWISATKDVGGGELHHALTATSRLSIWASVLLQHCPTNSQRQVVVLSGARHVFGWFKPLPTLSNTLFGASNALEQEWRRMNTVLTSTPRPDDTEFTLYKKHCQAYAMDLLEEAWSGNVSSSRRSYGEYYDYMESTTSTSSKTPVWGPIDDPVGSVYATSTWSGKVSADGKVTEPLLTFPLRIRSQNSVSKRDWLDMEESVEKAILDPLHPSRFVVQVYYDRDASVATLAANQRCVLAALIRSATLPGETLLEHLMDAELVELWDDDAGTVVALKLAEKSKCGNATRKIVQAMDWSSIMEDMISLEQAESIVHAVLQGDLVSGFPSSPEEQFLARDDLCLPFRRAAPYGRLVSLLFAHLAKLRALSSMSLVWTVFCQELRRRWHARESLPNLQYVAGLDPHPLELYQHRCFTTIGHKANFSAFLNGCEPDPDDYHCLIGQKLQVFQVGVECIVASELLEHEVMERFLEQGQVPASVKIGVDTPGRVPTQVGEDEEDDEYDDGDGGPKWRPVGSDKLPSELPPPPDDPPHPSKVVLTNGGKKRKWPKAKSSVEPDAAAPKADYGPPTINSDLEFWVMDEPGYAPRDAVGVEFAQRTIDDTGFDFVMPAPPDMDDLDADDSLGDYNRQRRRASMMQGTSDLTDLRGWEGTIMQDEEQEDSEGSGDSAASRTTTCSLSQAYFDAAEAGSIFSMKHGFVTLDTVVNVADMRRRPGARCPVHKVMLSTGDQLYAPYLQRPAPLTDDLVMERKHMLANEQREGESRKAVLQARIELAHRLQRPKLLSDMSAFKAANPNATIDDFTRWYGNPGSPLDDYDDPLPDDVSVADAYYESAAKKLDRASEAMKILVATRDFWASTWEKAAAVPAAEQQPLFDFESTVEMALDYLEQMHPANLVNQVMAVNLSSAYFALVSSAEDALKVPLFKATVQKLRHKLERALQSLADDATGALFQAASSDNASTSTATANQYISEESIFACEEACNALSVTETMLARAVSLLSKFPCQYMLVQELLRLTDGTTVALTDPLGRKGCLDAIYQQQRQRNMETTDRLPKPVLREYVLRNLDDDKPCQLAVRFGDAGAYLGRVENEGGVLLAILKSYTD